MKSTKPRVIHGIQTLKVNPLAQKTQVLCSLCGSHATLICCACRTGYCGKEHLILDNLSTHKIVCNKLSHLHKHSRLPLSQQSKPEQQALVRKIRQEIADTCFLRSRIHLLDDNLDLAMPAAQRCYTFSSLIYPTNSLHLVPSLTNLAEIANAIGATELCLSRVQTAHWIIASFRDQQPPLHTWASQKCREVADMLARVRLVAAASSPMGQETQALAHLAEGCYAAAIGQGPRSLQSAALYFTLGSFLRDRLGALDRAGCCWEAALSVWYEQACFLEPLPPPSYQSHSISADDEATWPVGLQADRLEASRRLMELSSYFEEIHGATSMSAMKSFVSHVMFQLVSDITAAPISEAFERLDEFGAEGKQMVKDLAMLCERFSIDTSHYSIPE